MRATDVSSSASAPPLPVAHAEPQTTHRRRNFALLTGASTMDNTEQSIVSVLYPSVQAALGLSLSALGTLVAATKLVGVVTGPLWVMLARRTNRRIVLATCSGFWGMWIVAAGFSQNYIQLLVLYVLAAAGFCGAAPIVTEILGDVYGDRRRGRASGHMYGTVALLTAASGPLFGQLSHFDNGWRYGYFISGTICVLLGVSIVLFMRDPGVGAAEPQLAGLSIEEREVYGKITFADARELFKIPTFVLMLIQRLLSGHLLLIAFGVVYLVQVFGFSNAQASLVILPYGVGYFAGTLVGGALADRVHIRFPQHGRIAYLQIAQLAFAGVAFVGTQFAWGSIWIFAGFFAVLGALQSANPVIKVPIVMAVVRPEVRGLAFALLISVMESLAWAIFSLGAGYLGDLIGLQRTFLLILVALMVVNGAFVTLIYRPYVRDSAAMQKAMERRVPPGSVPS